MSTDVKLPARAISPAILAFVVHASALLSIADAPAVAAQAPASVAGKRMTPNLQLVWAAFDRWRAGRGFFDQLLVEDVRWTIHGSGPLARTYTSRESFMREAVQPFAARLERPVVPTIRYIVGQDDLVIVVWDGESTAKDGVAYRNEYVWIFKLRDGKAVAVEAFLDLVPYYDVLNRIPSPR
jgi:uncharacterized protein